MGACAMLYGKIQESIQEPQKKTIHTAVNQEIQKQLKEQVRQAEPIILKQILLEVNNNEMTSSLTKSWKTQTRSRFYKQKACYNSQGNALYQSSQNIKEPSSNFTSDIMEKNTSKRFKRFKITKQEQTADHSSEVHSQRSGNYILSSKDENQVNQNQSISIRAKNILILPKVGQTQTDRKLIQSTANISTKTLIHQKILYVDRSVYFGEWKFGMRYGHGKLQWINGCVYEGGWSKNMVEGTGTLTYTDGQRYSGNFVKNQAHGKGEYYFLDGSKYVGEWVNNLPEGNGTHYFTKQQKFTGMWSKGKKNGYGELEFEDGSYYKGQFLNNEIHGIGQYNYGDKIYNGNWEHNEKSGKGCMELADGSRYEGMFFHDKMHGKGMFFDINGTTYEGKWLNGRKDGVFLEHRPNGQIVKSEWYFNKLVKQCDKRFAKKITTISQNT